MPSISQTQEHTYCYACEITEIQLLFKQAEEGLIQDKPKERVLRDIRAFAQEKGVQEPNYYYSCAKFYEDCKKLLGAENVVPCWNTFKNSEQCKDLVATHFDPSSPKKDSEEEKGFVYRVFKTLGLY